MNSEHVYESDDHRQLSHEIAAVDRKLSDHLDDSAAHYSGEQMRESILSLEKKLAGFLPVAEYESRSDEAAAERQRVTAQMEQLMGEMAKVSQSVGYLADEYLGPEVPQFDGSMVRAGGGLRDAVEALNDRIDALSTSIRNGNKTRLTLSKGAWTAIGALIGALGLIAAALIGLIGQ